MSAHAFDKTIMLLLALIQGATATYFEDYATASARFKFAREISDEITQNQSTKDSELSMMEEHLAHLTQEKNFKLIAYENLAEAYFYGGKYANATQAYKKLLMLAWQ